MNEADPIEKPSAYTLLWRAREVLLSMPEWLDYARRVYSIDPGGYPFLTYLGINFTKDTIKNYKFYFSFFKRLSPDEIATLLPVPNRGRFESLYEQWHPSHHYNVLHRGTTFAVKVEPGRPITYYYHLRLRGLPFGPPERMVLHESDRDNFHGACEEFTGDQIHLKRYYYLRDPRSLAESLRIGGLPERTAGMDLVEYIESEGRDKMAWITSDQVLMDTLIKERGPPRLASGLLNICRTNRFYLFGPGSARDGSDHSIYFIEDAGVRGGYGYLFDGVRSFAQRQLKLPHFPEHE